MLSGKPGTIFYTQFNNFTHLKHEKGSLLRKREEVSGEMEITVAEGDPSRRGKDSPAPNSPLQTLGLLWANQHGSAAPRTITLFHAMILSFWERELFVHVFSHSLMSFFFVMFFGDSVGTAWRGGAVHVLKGNPHLLCIRRRPSTLLLGT